VVHAVTPGRVGGLESVVQALAIGQHSNGCRVSVCSVVAPGDEDLPLHQALMAGGVSVTPVVIRGRHYLDELRQITDVLGRVAPDIVHTHGYRSDLIAGRAARSQGFKTVSTVHGFTGGDWKNRLYERLQSRSFRRFDAIVAVSRPLVARLTGQGVPRDRIHLIPNGWGGSPPALDREEARRILGIPADEFVVGWVGRLSREKGADVLLDSLPMISGSTTVSILGEGRESDRLRTQAESLGISNRIRWHGTIPGANRLYRAFDVFALSSRTEGTPIALFEAMAAGVPIVATAVGGVPDVIRDEEAQLVPGESPRELAQAIVALLENPGRRKSLAEAAAARLADAYALPAWVARYAGLYGSLLVSR
jgi:glycosyltransferase involved in cell wall biosynthesis